MKAQQSDSKNLDKKTPPAEAGHVLTKEAFLVTLKRVARRKRKASRGKGKSKTSA